MMLWRVCANSLPTGDKFGSGSETLCPLCKSDTETPWHLFVKCPFASALWFASPLPLRVNALPCVDMVDFISDLCNNTNPEMRTSILICAAATFETIWNYKNQVIHSPSDIQPCINRALFSVFNRFHEMTPKDSSCSRMATPSIEPPPSLSIPTV
uniref:Reverse transcriptase zinc-binding domain-containing protein n=1 Tax=Cannabis sativa TaxID=3483 RepID=A0A803PYK0_CANSA